MAGTRPEPRTTSRLSPALPLAAALLAAGMASASEPKAEAATAELSRPARLPLAQCLDPERARGWTLLANDELLVDAGRLRYHVRLSMACPELGTTAQAEFRAGGGFGRLCGHPTDVVIPRHALRDQARPCPIASMRVVDKSEYEALLPGANAASVQIEANGRGD